MQTSVPSPGTPLTFTLLTDGNDLEAWQKATLDRLLGRLATAVLRVIAHGDDHGDEGRFSPTGAAWKWYTRARLEGEGRARQRRPVPSSIAALPTRTVSVARHGSGRGRLPDDVIEQIRDARCDFVLNFSGRALHGLPEAVCRFGMWEHRIAVDTDASRLALRSRDPTLLELTLVRVTAPGAADEVLQRGWIHNVPHSVAATLDAAHFATADWLVKTCRSIAETGTLAPEPTPPRRPAVLRGPGMAPLVANAAWRRLQWAVRQLIWQEEWHVGVIDQPIDAIFRSERLGETQWLSSPSRRHYLADPFGLDGVATLLAEDFDYLTRRGRIVALELPSPGKRPITMTALQGAGHLSYPCLIRREGEIFCVPESSDQRNAILYRARRFPDVWDPVCTLVDGLAVTDATLFTHDGSWWMFCTDDELGPGSNLHVYHARTLTGPWTPHRLNPVKIDIRSARPAGTPFMVDGTLIRPAQTNDRGYGSGIVFNAVERLSEREFNESPVAYLEPDQRGPYRHGVHTISAWGDRTLVDGKRKGPSLINLAGRVRALLR